MFRWSPRGNMKNSVIISLVAVFWMALANRANANVVSTFSDRTAWSIAAGAVTNLDFAPLNVNGPLRPGCSVPQCGITDYGVGPVALGPLTFTALGNVINVNGS